MNRLILISEIVLLYNLNAVGRRVIYTSFRRYSSRAKPLDTGEYNAGYHAEGFCYWRGMSAQRMAGQIDTGAPWTEIHGLR